MKESIAVWVSGVVCVVFLLWVAYQFYEGWVGEKCPHCKCRSTEWLQWHQMEKDDYRGWIWCPNCFHKKWEGFQDRVYSIG